MPLLLWLESCCDLEESLLEHPLSVRASVLLLQFCSLFQLLCRCPFRFGGVLKGQPLMVLRPHDGSRNSLVLLAGLLSRGNWLVRENKAVV